MQETQKSWVWSLGWEDPLEKEMATHSSIPAWKVSWTEQPGKLYNPWGHKESDTTEHKILVPVAFNTCKPDTTVLTKVWHYSSEFIWW